MGGAEILLVASCYRNRDKFWPDGPLGSHADFTCLCGPFEAEPKRYQNCILTPSKGTTSTPVPFMRVPPGV